MAPVIHGFTLWLPAPLKKLRKEVSHASPLAHCAGPGACPATSPPRRRICSSSATAPMRCCLRRRHGGIPRHLCLSRQRRAGPPFHDLHPGFGARTVQPDAVLRRRAWYWSNATTQSELSVTLDAKRARPRAGLSPISSTVTSVPPPVLEATISVVIDSGGAIIGGGAR